MSNTTTKAVRTPTKRERFNELLAIPAVSANAELVAFIEHELDLLSRKNVTASGEKKLTDKQKSNEVIKDAIIGAMEPNRAYTIAELIKEMPGCADLSNQHMTRLIYQLVAENKVTKTVDKRKSYFTIV